MDSPWQGRERERGKKESKMEQQRKLLKHKRGETENFTLMRLRCRARYLFNLHFTRENSLHIEGQPGAALLLWPHYSYAACAKLVSPHAHAAPPTAAGQLPVCIYVRAMCVCVIIRSLIGRA